MVPSEARERLSAGIYKTIEPSNPVGLLQEALVLAQSAEPLEKRIRVEGVKTGRITATDFPAQIEEALALGLLNASEAGLLRDYDRKVMELIHVDDFDAAELAAASHTEATHPSWRQIA
jgi:acyl-CoA dehydrogenase